MAEAKLAPATLSRPGRLDGLAANWKSDRVQVLWAFGFAGFGVCGARRSTSSFAGRGPPATGGSPRQTPCLPCATIGNQWQPTATVLACSSRFRGHAICDRLPPVAPAWLFLKKGRVSSHRCSFTSSRTPERSDAHLFLGAWRAHRVGGSCLGFSVP